jgi:glycosyltransferase involved in cell wall biosynthesis
MADLVSLIMPAYSPNPAWLNQAIESALAQTGCEVELVLIDDGSPRPVAEFVDPKLLSRIETLTIEHAGAGPAREAGVAASRGSWLRFVDADDVFPVDSTARLLSLSAGSVARIACGATRWCDDQLRPRFDWIASCGADPVKRLLLLRANVMLPSALFPREVVEAAGPWASDITVSEDWEYMLRAFELAPVVETAEVVALYRQHPHSTSRDRRASWDGTQKAIERYFERHPDQRHGRRARQVDAMKGLLAAELERPGAPWRDLRFWRTLMREPSSAATVYRRIVHPAVQARRMRIRRRRDGWASR